MFNDFFLFFVNPPIQILKNKNKTTMVLFFKLKIFKYLAKLSIFKSFISISFHPSYFYNKKIEYI